MLHRLSDLKIRSLRRTGNHCDGGGLYLQVRKTNGRITKSWLFRYGRRWMGLGSLDVVSLAEARRKAAECRRLRSEGIDPIDSRRAAKASKAVAAAKTMTFDQCR